MNAVRPILLGWLSIMLLPVQPAAKNPPAGQSGFFTTSDGVRLHYLQAGQGRSILFVPGWTMPAWIWEHQIACFSRNYHVVALDPRSHGDSERVTEGHYPNRLARDIRELTQHLELPETVLVGWSMGALQVLTAVEQFGTGWLSAVVLVDEVLGYSPNAWINPRRLGKGRLELQSDRKGVTDRFVRGMYKRPQPEEYLQRIMAASLRTPTNTAVTLGASFRRGGRLAQDTARHRPASPPRGDGAAKKTGGRGVGRPSFGPGGDLRTGRSRLVRRRARPLQPAPAGFPRPGRIGPGKHLFFRAFCKIPQAPVLWVGREDREFEG